MLKALSENLCVGLRLALLRRNCTDRVHASVSALWLLAFASIAVSICLQGLLYRQSVIFQSEGLYFELLTLAFLLAAACLTGRTTRSGAHRLRQGVVLLSAWFWISPLLELQVWVSQALLEEGLADTLLFWLVQAWILIVVLKCLSVSSEASGTARRTALALIMVFGLQQLPLWFYPIEFWVPGYAASSNESAAQLNAENILTAQPALLEERLNELQPSAAGTVDMYFVGYAPWGDQAVFGNEVRFAKRLFDKRYGTTGRSLALISSLETSGSDPLAITSNLSATLTRLASISQPEEDILFLFISSHGSDTFDVGTALGELPLNDLPAVDLSAMLKDSGFRWKVITISTCYSGGHIPGLAGETDLIMTAARSDRTSFGCSDDAEYTYFGRAYFVNALAKEADFIKAFDIAKAAVGELEKEDGYSPSEPQISIGSQIEVYLDGYTEAL